MKQIYKVIFLGDINDYDVVTDVKQLPATKVHPAMVQATLVATTKGYDGAFESVPDLKFYSPTVFKQAVPIKNKQELGTFACATTKTELFMKLLKE